MLHDLMKPFAACARTIFLNSAIITAISAVVLVVIRYVFLSTCHSSEVGLPYAEDTRVFGLLTAMISNTIAVLPLASKKRLINPVADYILTAIAGTTAYVLAWICRPHIRALDYIYQAFIPILVVTGSLSSYTIYSEKATITGFLIKPLLNSVAFLLVFFCYLSGAIVCFHLSNERTLAFLNKPTMALKEDVAMYFSNLFLLGVAFPLFRYAVIFANRSIIVAWKSPTPTSRPQEIAINAGKLIFVMSQEAMWNSIGNIIIFRSQSHLFYYLGLAGFQLAYATERLFSCYYFRRKLRNRLNTINSSPDDKDFVNIVVAKQTEETDDGAAASAFEPRRYSRSVPLQPALSSRMSRHSSRVMDDTQRSSYLSAKGSVHTRDFGSKTQKPLEQIDKVTEEEEPQEEHPPNSSLETPHSLDSAFRNLSQNVLSKQSEELFGVDVPFIPLEEKVIYGYHRLGSMVGEWASRGVSFFIVLLFVSLPDVSLWTRYFGFVPISDLFIRLAIWPLFAILSEFLCTYAESRILDLDFTLSVNEFNSNGLSLASFTFVISLICQSAGPFLIAETRVLGQTPVFQPGRRIWGLTSKG